MASTGSLPLPLAGCSQMSHGPDHLYDMTGTSVTYTHMPAYFITMVQHFFNIHQPKEHVLLYVVPDGDYNDQPNNDSFKKDSYLRNRILTNLCLIFFWRLLYLSKIFED